MKKLLPYLLIFFALAILIAILTAANYRITPQLSGGESFRVKWMGARSYLFEHSNPYTLESAKETQIAIYGHLARADEYPYRLDTPFYLLVFYFPLALIENFDLARALWMSFAEIALFGVGFLSIYLAEWKISRTNLALFFLALFFSFYGAYPLMETSDAIFTALILFLALIAYREKWDEVLGVLLIFSISTLQNGGLLFFFILFLVFSAKRWRVFSVFAMTLSVFLAVSLIFLSDWLLPFAGALRDNAEIGQGFLLSETLQLWRDDGALIVSIASILKWIFLLILILEWRTARNKKISHILWVASLSIILVPFFNISITAALLPALFLPLALLLKTAQSRWKNAKFFIPLSFLFLLFAWLIFLRAPHATEILTFALPLALLLALYWMRWWLIRPPRTWADKVIQR